VTVAVVLAAGGSTRFGGQGRKLLASFRGRPLVQWAVEHALDAALDETVVVTGAADILDVLPPGVTIVENPHWDKGMASSIWVGVHWAELAGHDAVVIGLGDQPGVPPSAWRAVADAPGPLAVATFEGHRRPPVRLARDIWPLLPLDGEKGARAVMQSRPDLVTEVACEGQPFDIDTPEDLLRWG
jgi:CTP:molybdopterin cytidylyltransferase MocA